LPGVADRFGLADAVAEGVVTIAVLDRACSLDYFKDGAEVIIPLVSLWC